MKLDFTKTEASALLEVLRGENDLVRLVEPEGQQVLQASGEKSGPGACCKLWGRCERCENCTSLRALRTQGRAYKIELYNRHIFWVTSRYLRVDGASCVLEIVSDATGSLLLDSNQRDEIGRMIQNYNRQIITDSMTELYNRRFLDEDFLPSLRCCRDRNIPVSLAMLDLDDFKKVNDVYGHQAGDALLKDAAGYWRRRFNSRESGKERLAVRYGGDEILIVGCGIRPETFRSEIEKYDRQMRKVCYCAPNLQIPFGVTIGIASSAECGPDWSWEALLGLADRRMYDAKVAKKSKA